MQTQTRDRLSSLKAKKREEHEETKCIAKEALIFQRKLHLSHITSLQHYVTATSSSNNNNNNTIPNLERLQQSQLLSSQKLAELQSSCSQEEEELHTKVNEFVTLLHDLEAQIQQYQALQNSFALMPQPSTSLPECALEAEANRLQALMQLRDAEDESLEAKCSLLEQEVKSCELEKLRLQQELDHQLLAFQAKRESEGPQRQQYDIILGFTKLKRDVHEKLSGHAISSVSGGRSLQLCLKEDGAQIELEFDGEHKLVRASTESILTGSKTEAELRSQAVRNNDPAWFVRKIKLLIHNSMVLEKELADLKHMRLSKFAFEYKSGTRMVTALFREVVSVKLRVPFDYTVSPVELVQLESTIVKRARNTLEDKTLERMVRERLAGKGFLVKDWILAIYELV